MKGCEMDWKKFKELSTEKQIKALRKEDHKSEANQLEGLYKSIEHLRKTLDLLRGYLFAEVNLLRAEEAMVLELNYESAAKRKIVNSFIETTTVKNLAKHRKNATSLKINVENLQKLRAEKRSLLNVQSGLLAEYIEECLDIIDSCKQFEIPQWRIDAHDIDKIVAPAKVQDPDYDIHTGKIVKGSAERRRRDEEARERMKKSRIKPNVPWENKSKTP